MKVIFQRNTSSKFILKQPHKQRERILSAIAQLPKGDVVAMAGGKERYRLRVGDYRIVFSVDHEEDLITIHNAGNRGDVYKG